MAIITNVVDERGNMFEQQYVNVHRLLVNKDTMIVEAGVHHSEQSARDGAPPHRAEAIYSVPFDMNSDLNPWQQAYVAIKNRWPDSTDC